MLEQTISLIRGKVENHTDAKGNLVLQDELLHFHKDAAPPHYYIFRRASIELCPGSPDYNFLHFSLWRNLESITYKKVPDIIDELIR